VFGSVAELAVDHWLPDHAEHIEKQATFERRWYYIRPMDFA
jgi:hypothetical protein